mmetsp:Transcript_71879/g.153652  ORF Transcript_71879/g.153652 Transcript_71879/m.153652 type:complete len:217 (-) Transcript_71879:185-835(-)
MGAVHESYEDQDRQDEVHNVAHDPSLATPPNEEARQPLEAIRAMVLVALAETIDRLIKAPEIEEGLPHRDGKVPQQEQSAKLTRLLDPPGIVHLLPKQLASALRQHEDSAEDEGQPDEGDPYRGDPDDVRPIVLGTCEGLVQAMPSETPRRRCTPKDREDAQRSGESERLLAAPDGQLRAITTRRVRVDHAVLCNVDHENKQHELARIEHQRRLHA